MPNYRKRGEPGRFCKDGPEVRAWPINVRCTQAEHRAYLAAGGADWLRAMLNVEIQRQRTQPAPTAHQPFPPTHRSRSILDGLNPGDKGGPTGY